MNPVYKVSLLAIFFTACSSVTFNASICNEIASQPNAVVPQECRIYNEDEATKAFNNEKSKSSFDINDTVEFTK